MKHKTVESLRMELGLQEPHSYIENHRHGGQCMGKTTLLLLEAVVESQYREVLILGFCSRYTMQLQAKARMMALQVDLPIKNIIMKAAYYKDKDQLHHLIAGKNCKVFIDHYY